MSIFQGDGFTIEWLGIQPRLVLTGIPSTWDVNAPTAVVTIEKSGEMTTMQWPWGWLPVANDGDDGYQVTTFVAHAYARNRIELFWDVTEDRS